MDTAHASNANAETVRRACLPEILFTPDVALAFGGVSPATARRRLLDGTCGPIMRIGRRLAVRREAFLDALAAREVDPTPAPSRPRVLRAAAPKGGS